MEAIPDAGKGLGVVVSGKTPEPLPQMNMMIVQNKGNKQEVWISLSCGSE